jgi:hypothetical protein
MSHSFVQLSPARVHSSLLLIALGLSVRGGFASEIALNKLSCLRVTACAGTNLTPCGTADEPPCMPVRPRLACVHCNGGGAAAKCVPCG